jgi:capsular polysaccharide transport system permease protein
MAFAFDLVHRAPMTIPAHIVTPRTGSFFDGLSTQCRVIGALLMREIHTRYGRENIGYLWLIGEPMLLAGVMGLIHHTGHTQFGSDIKPLAFTIVGYTTFIMFRGVVNRSEGAMDANAPLLYHRMVTIFDIVTARALLEAAGTVLAYMTLMSFLAAADLVALPARPLYYLFAQLMMFWCSWAQSLIVSAITFENRTIGRLVHPYSYFMIPLSGAFFQVSWIPEPYRWWLMWIPLPHILELARYGQFNSANLKYFNGPYLIAVCTILTWIGLVTVRIYRRKMHLA